MNDEVIATVERLLEMLTTATKCQCETMERLNAQDWRGVAAGLQEYAGLMLEASDVCLTIAERDEE